jgi:type II secretory pathway component PulJ
MSRNMNLWKRMCQSQNDQRGMTLVELTITMVVTLTVATGVIVFMVSGLRNFSTASAKANILAQAQTAMDKISADIVSAAAADDNNRIDDSHSPIGGNPNGWASDSDTLILATAAENSAGNIIYADATQYISYKNNVVYFLNNGTLYRRVLAVSVAGNKAKTTCPMASVTATCPGDSTILDNVTSLTFTYQNHANQTVSPDDARSVEMSVTVQSKAYKSAKATYKTRQVFRND